MWAFIDRPGYLWAFASNPLHIIWNTKDCVSRYREEFSKVTMMWMLELEKVGEFRSG